MNADETRTLGGLAGLFPLVYARSGALVAGHHRKEAARRLGAEWPSVMVRTEDARTIGRMALASNVQQPLSSTEQQAAEALGADAVRLLAPDQPGLRPLNAEHVRALARSVAEYGYQDYPWWAIIRDRHGRILAGRHRIAVAHMLRVNWRVVTLDVADDAAALEIALVANLHAGWTQRDLRRIKPENVGLNSLIREMLARKTKHTTKQIAEALWHQSDLEGPTLEELSGLVRRIRRAKGEKVELAPFCPHPIPWGWMVPPLQPAYVEEGSLPA